jgi:hypothetical protein
LYRDYESRACDCCTPPVKKLPAGIIYFYSASDLWSCGICTSHEPGSLSIGFSDVCIAFISDTDVGIFILDAKLWHQLQTIFLPSCWDLDSIISARTTVNACLYTKIFAAFFCREDFSEDFCSIPLFYPTMIVLCTYGDYDIHSVALAAIGGAFR